VVFEGKQVKEGDETEEWWIERRVRAKIAFRRRWLVSVMSRGAPASLRSFLQVHSPDTILLSPFFALIVSLPSDQ
jgi:hypothetical protein